MTRNKPIPCLDFSVLLAEVLDGRASDEALETIRAHAAVCAECRTLHELAREGKNWLGTLDEVEPPASLVHNILATTSLATAAIPKPSPRPHAWLTALGLPLLLIVRRPRLVPTAAMAFFSVSLLVNMTGVSVTDLRVGGLRELRPRRIGTRLSLQYHATTSRVVRYYENSRFVYELETRLRDLRENAVAKPEGTPSREDRRPGGRSGVEEETQVNG